MPSETQEAPVEAISRDTTISQSTAKKKPKQILGKVKSKGTLHLKYQSLSIIM